MRGEGGALRALAPSIFDGIETDSRFLICFLDANQSPPRHQVRGRLAPEIALAKSERKQAGAEQEQAGSRHSQETIGGEFITHDNAPKSSYPLTARDVPAVIRRSVLAHFGEIFLGGTVNAPFLDHLDRGVHKNQTHQ